jgi:tight adherence protein B
VRRLVAAVALALLVPAAGASAMSARLSEAGSANGFPQRSWVLTFADATRATADIDIRENGEAVRDLRVVAAGEAGSGVVLVLDTSSSMHGRPIVAATEAARAFASHRKEHQRLGLVTFNERAVVAVPLTADGAAVDAALARPPALADGTALFDGVRAGVRLLRDRRAETGAVVVLSDGDDNRSSARMEQVVAEARRQHVRVFVVGLKSRVFSPQILKPLAEGTGGTAAIATSTKALRGIFDALGERIANEFLVSYRSVQPAETRVRVEADADGGAPDAVASYMTPAVPSLTPKTPETEVPGAFWTSAKALALVALTVALLLALASALALRRPSRRGLEHRVAEFTPTDVPLLDEPRTTSLVGWLSGQLERLLRARRWWLAFGDDVDVARIERSPSEIAALTALATFVAGALGVLAGGPALVLAGLLPPVLVWVVVRRRAHRQRRAFEDQLPDALQVFASGLRAGHSFVGALRSVVEDAPEPTRREFTGVLTNEQLGVPPEESLTRIGERMKNPQLAQVAVVASLQHETGGNTAEVLDRVVEAVRDRREVLQLVRSLTAQGRITQVVVTALPVGLAVVVTALNPGYLNTLLEQPIGVAMLIASIVMTVAGSIAISKIVNIKV